MAGTNKEKRRMRLALACHRLRVLCLHMRHGWTTAAQQDAAWLDGYETATASNDHPHNPHPHPVLRRAFAEGAAWADGYEAAASNVHPHNPHKDPVLRQAFEEGADWARTDQAHDDAERHMRDMAANYAALEREERDAIIDECEALGLMPGRAARAGKDTDWADGAHPAPSRNQPD